MRGQLTNREFRVDSISNFCVFRSALRGFVMTGVGLGSVKTSGATFFALR